MKKIISIIVAIAIILPATINSMTLSSFLTHIKNYKRNYSNQNRNALVSAFDNIQNPAIRAHATSALKQFGGIEHLRKNVSARINRSVACNSSNSNIRAQRVAVNVMRPVAQSRRQTQTPANRNGLAEAENLVIAQDLSLMEQETIALQNAILASFNDPLQRAIRISLQDAQRLEQNALDLAIALSLADQTPSTHSRRAMPTSVTTNAATATSLATPIITPQIVATPIVNQPTIRQPAPVALVSPTPASVRGVSSSSDRNKVVQAAIERTRAARQAAQASSNSTVALPTAISLPTSVAVSPTISAHTTPPAVATMTNPATHTSAAIPSSASNNPAAQNIQIEIPENDDNNDNGNVSDSEQFHTPRNIETPRHDQIEPGSSSIQAGAGIGAGSVSQFFVRENDNEFIVRFNGQNYNLFDENIANSLSQIENRDITSFIGQINKLTEAQKNRIIEYFYATFLANSVTEEKKLLKIIISAIANTLNNQAINESILNNPVFKNLE